MKLPKLLISVIALTFFKVASSENVLVLCPMSSKSHKNLFDPIISELAKRGNQVTVVSAWKPPKPQENVTDIIALDGFNWARDFNPFEERRAGFMGVMAQGFQFLLDACHEVYANEDVLNLLQQRFDLILIDSLANECVHGLIYKLNAPYIWISGFAPPNAISSMLGNHLPPSFVPIMGLPFTDEMTFSQRITNFLIDAYFGFFIDSPYAAFEEIYRHKLGDDVPGLEKIFRNVSLILMNSHFSVNFPRPTLPDVVEIGGIQIQPLEKDIPLSDSVENFLSDWHDGFIYFSLGSMINPSDMPEATRKVFVNVFSRLRQRVLWKWPMEDMSDLSGNVKLSSWLPQQKVLSHPNIKLFITHGGLLSTQEAIQHGVPLIGIPISFDQDMNMHSAESSGIGLKIEIIGLTEETLESAIVRVLNETSFKDNAHRLSNIFKDRINSPLDTAMYWIEYVMRHKGAHHLRSAARKLNTFQYHSLDVIATLLLASLFLLCSIVSILIFVGRKLYSLFLVHSQKQKLN